MMEKFLFLLGVELLYFPCPENKEARSIRL